MPRVAKELSGIELRQLSHPGSGGNRTVAVGGVAGLMVQITPSGAKSWLLRTHIAGRRREIGLGGFPEVSLAAARERAREAKDKIWRGIDPLEEKRATQAALAAAKARGLTFDQAAERYLATKAAELRNTKHAAQWGSTLSTYASPKIGTMMVAEIGVSDIQRVLAPIWEGKTETATRLRGRIEAVLAWATVNGHRTGDNPARWKGNLSAILPRPEKMAKAEHQPALSLTDAPAWFAHLRTRDGMAARALELLTMTAARSGEIRGATWAEIDLDTGLWVIPAERMKAAREHRVPLIKKATDLLRALPRINNLVFPAPRGGQLSDMSISAVMRRMQEGETKAGRKGWLDQRSGRPAVPHGLRSTFRDWAAEKGVDRDLAEIALAHNVGSAVERAYRRSDMMQRRAVLMVSWGAFLRGEVAEKVVPIRGAK